jgi:hypothetical protein
MGNVPSPFSTQQITILKVELSYSVRLHVAFMEQLIETVLTITPLLATPYARFVIIILIYHGQIHLVLLEFSTAFKISNIIKNSAITVSQCKGPSKSSLKDFWPQIMLKCSFSRNSAHPEFLPLIGYTTVGLPTALAK